MAFAINTNVAALNSYRNLSNTQNDISKSLEKLSTGLRINRAADDAAGLAISEGLRSQVNGLNVAARNAQDGISVIQTAEGALTEVHSILQRMRDLAVQAGNDSNNEESRSAISTEATQLIDELGRIAEVTNFNGRKLLSGDLAVGTETAGKTALSFQIGAGSDTTVDQISVDFASADVADLASRLATGGADELLFGDATAAAAAVATLDAEITAISTARADLGAIQNRFEHTIKNLNVSAENLSASESRIRDTDMAQEMAKFTKNQIMSQAGTAMLAQANQINQGVLQLLG